MLVEAGNFVIAYTALLSVKHMSQLSKLVHTKQATNFDNHTLAQTLQDKTEKLNAKHQHRT